MELNSLSSQNLIAEDLPMMCVVLSPFSTVAVLLVWAVLQCQMGNYLMKIGIED